MYDEEKLEERVNAFPPALRQLWQPDGMSAPPESRPVRPIGRKDPESCDHGRSYIIEIVGGGKPPMTVCLECGKELPS